MAVDDLLYNELTEELIGIRINIHRELGPGFLEIVYKDVFQYELENEEILYEREKVFPVRYKELILSRKFVCDFYVYNKIIVEIKSKKSLVEEHYAQTLNYLKCADCRLALLLNFGESKLGIKRVIR